MLNDQALLRMAKSMESLNQTILSLKKRITDGIQTLDDIYNSMYEFNVSGKQEEVYDIDSRQKDLIDAYNRLIFEAKYANELIINSKQQLDDIVDRCTGGQDLNKISSTSDDIGDINEKCIVEQIKIIFNKINSLGKANGRLSYFKSLPVVDKNAVIQTNVNQEQETPGQDLPAEIKNENVLAYIASSSSSSGQILCSGRFAQLLAFKFNIKRQNIKLFISGGTLKSSGSIGCSGKSSSVKVTYKFENDDGNYISNSNIPQNGMLFVCIQGKLAGKVSQSIVAKINALTNVPIFILLDIGDKTASTKFIDGITTSNPCLIWNSPHATLTSKPLSGAGGYLMNLLQQIVTPSSTQYEKASYQVMFDLMLSKYDKMTKTNLNNFNEALPIFTK